MDSIEQSNQKAMISMNNEARKERLHKKFEETSLKSKSSEQKSRLVYLWCKNILQQWKHALEQEFERLMKTKLTSDFKQEKVIFQSCETNLKPLISMLKKEKCTDEILNHLFLIVQYCMFKEFEKANDVYMRLCIGNSPWPMGVTMVGIHERSGRSKIFSSQVAHILKDETQRKQLQSIKRLMSFCQKKT